MAPFAKISPDPSPNQESLSTSLFSIEPTNAPADQENFEKVGNGLRMKVDEQLKAMDETTKQASPPATSPDPGRLTSLVLIL